MEPPLVNVEDLEYRLGRTFNSEELPRVEAVLDDASALVRMEAGQTWIDPLTGDIAAVPAPIRTIVLRVAERVMRNPQGFKSESAGDYSYQRTDGDSSLYLTDREIAMIRRALGRSGLWTQPVERGDDYCATLFVEDNYGCELFPLTAEGD